jgi:FkbM family methyltransferase
MAPLTAALVDKTAADIRTKSKLVRTADGLELWDTPRGYIWVLANDFATMCHVFGEQEAEIYGDAIRGVHKDDIVLDCGAHFGGFVKTALDRGAKKVIAIDIAPEVLESLRRTFKEEIAAGKVVVYGKGVWDHDGEMKLHRADHAWADQVGTKGPESVQITTIDKIVAELALPRVDFIKMDIEGAERNALAGARETLGKYQPRMAIAAYHQPDDFTSLPAVALAAQPAYRSCLANAKLGWGFATLFFDKGAR